MQKECEAKVLTSEAKEYDFDGNKGISYKVRLNIDGEIYAIKVSKEVQESLVSKVGSDITAVISVSSPKERLQMNLVSFE